jgi:hypothetical protein
MSKQTQREAVYNAVSGVLSEAGIKVEGDVSTHMTRELRSQVNNILFEAFRKGTIALDKEFTDSELKSYVSGLQSNWLRKDKRLNGGVAYVVQNPGSRAGSGDASLKAMRALMSTLTSDSEKAEVQSHIDTRLGEIKASKAKTSKSIDYSALPTELAAKFGK